MYKYKDIYSVNIISPHICTLCEVLLGLKRVPEMLALTRSSSSSVVAAVHPDQEAARINTHLSAVFQR